ncbi:hypothetical protein CEXT_675731 [Caerostris extrusa]|uniref:Uncharacterized protein n=1 Tax=Caerostris extrusa TaxID=172846 RepID=A0AAV4PS44_CAEEX|nr:hypothetical protein CEXT_675731 [Caerostris extrusa]
MIVPIKSNVKSNAMFVSVIGLRHGGLGKCPVTNDQLNCQRLKSGCPCKASEQFIHLQAQPAFISELHRPTSTLNDWVSCRIK